MALSSCSPLKVVGIMKVNVEKVLERDAKLAQLDDRAGILLCNNIHACSMVELRKPWIEGVRIGHIGKLCTFLRSFESFAPCLCAISLVRLHSLFYSTTGYYWGVNLADWLPCLRYFFYLCLTLANVALVGSRYNEAQFEQGVGAWPEAIATRWQSR